jgi:hypothetical protein
MPGVVMVMSVHGRRRMTVRMRFVGTTVMRAIPVRVVVCVIVVRMIV